MWKGNFDIFKSEPCLLMVCISVTNGATVFDTGPVLSNTTAAGGSGVFPTGHIDTNGRIGTRLTNSKITFKVQSTVVFVLFTFLCCCSLGTFRLSYTFFRWVE